MPRDSARINSSEHCLPLFTRNYPRLDIFEKTARYLLERKMNSLTRRHAARRRQLAVFSFDYVSVQIMLDGLYEIDELEVFTQWLISIGEERLFEGVVVDIGANIGNHSLYFSDYFTEVLAFEPHPFTYKLLAMNAELVANVRCFNCGLSSETRTASMVLDGRNMSGARVARVGNGGSASSIRLETLDMFIGATCGRSVRLIKIDVEGHEFEVLAGAEVTIRKHQPIILFEQHPSAFAAGTSRTIDLLKSYGYECFACIEKTPRLPDRFPGALRGLLTALLRVLMGSSQRIVKVGTFKPRFYPFIIVIPNWLKAEITGEYDWNGRTFTGVKR